MSIDLKERKKRESITDQLPFPTTRTQKERYRRVQNELEIKGFGSLHEMTRERIDLLLDEVEAQLSVG